MGMGGQPHGPTALHAGKQSSWLAEQVSGCVPELSGGGGDEKNPVCAGNRNPVLQYLASRFNDYRDSYSNADNFYFCTFPSAWQSVLIMYTYCQDLQHEARKKLSLW
jgi:hypothetical protein